MWNKQMLHLHTSSYELFHFIQQIFIKHLSGTHYIILEHGEEIMSMAMVIFPVLTRLLCKQMWNAQADVKCSESKLVIVAMTLCVTSFILQWVKFWKWTLWGKHQSTGQSYRGEGLWWQEKISDVLSLKGKWSY